MTESQVEDNSNQTPLVDAISGRLSRHICSMGVPKRLRLTAEGRLEENQKFERQLHLSCMLHTNPVNDDGSPVSLHIPSYSQ